VAWIGLDPAFSESDDLAFGNHWATALEWALRLPVIEPSSLPLSFRLRSLEVREKVASERSAESEKWMQTTLAVHIERDERLAAYVDPKSRLHPFLRCIGSRRSRIQRPSSLSRSVVSSAWALAPEIDAALEGLAPKTMDYRSGYPLTQLQGSPRNTSKRAPRLAPNFDPAHINALAGGVGKSALVNHWLRRMAAELYGSAELVFGWSFYRQGTSGGTSSADEFLDAALTWFGDPDPRLGTAWEKGERLQARRASPNLIDPGWVGAAP
jgi:hypothetical protein